MIRNVLADALGFTKHMFNVILSLHGNPEWNLVTVKLGGEAVM